MREELVSEIQGKATFELLEAVNEVSKDLNQIIRVLNLRLRSKERGSVAKAGHKVKEALATRVI